MPLYVIRERDTRRCIGVWDYHDLTGEFDPERYEQVELPSIPVALLEATESLRYARFDEEGRLVPLEPPDRDAIEAEARADDVERDVDQDVLVALLRVVVSYVNEVRIAAHLPVITMDRVRADLVATLRRLRQR